MKEENDGYHVCISDVIEQEQERAVIEAVSKHTGKSREDLETYFQTTDTIELNGLTKGDAEALKKILEGAQVSVSVRSYGKSGGKGKPAHASCPRCGASLESADWRCPECYCEFPDYEFKGDE